MHGIKSLFVAILFLCSFGGASAKSVILVSDNIADSAVADAIKNVKAINIISTSWGEFRQDAADAIVALNPGEVLIIGGTAAVVSEYETALSNFTITRIAGIGRKETAVAVLRHFKDDFKGKRIAIANGDDAEGIRHALESAKKRKGILLFISGSDVPDDVASAVNEANASEVEGFLSPDVDESAIKNDIAAKTRAGVANITRGNITERAEKALQKAKDRVAEMDAFIGGLTTSRRAVEKLSEVAHKHLKNAEGECAERFYGRCFGQSISAVRVADNAIRIAKKQQGYEGDHKIEFKLTDEIKKLRAKVKVLEKIAGKKGIDGSIKETLGKAKIHLDEAESALDSGEHSSAIEHIDAAEHLVDKAKAQMKILQREVAKEELLMRR